MDFDIPEDMVPAFTNGEMKMMAFDLPAVHVLFRAVEYQIHNHGTDRFSDEIIGKLEAVAGVLEQHLS
jgi:hypothetical protein